MCEADALPPYHCPMGDNNNKENNTKQKQNRTNIFKHKRHKPHIINKFKQILMLNNFEL